MTSTIDIKYFETIIEKLKKVNITPIDPFLFREKEAKRTLQQHAEETNLELLGYGSFRAVFKLDDNVVVKMPYCNKEEAMSFTKEEYQLYKEYPLNKFFAPCLYEKDGYGFFQKVETFNSIEQFEVYLPQINSMIEFLLKTFPWHRKERRFIRDLLYKEDAANPMQVIRNWGLINGKPVILDYAN